MIDQREMVYTCVRVMAWDQDYLFKLWLSTHEAEYARQLDRFKGLDSKAQGAATSCGVFLAAAFALAKEPSHHTAASIILGIVSVLLAIALGLALLAAYVQEFEDAPSGHGLRRMSEDLLAVGDDLRIGDCAPFHRELADRWQAAIHSLRETNYKKSARLQGAQGILGITAVVATVGIGFVLFT